MDEEALTGLSDDKQYLYTVLFNLAVKMRHQRPHYWVNKNFEKARTLGLDSWYHIGLSIKT